MARDLFQEYGVVPQAAPTQSGGRDLFAEYGVDFKQPTFNPTEGNSFLQNAAIGAGKAVVDTGRGLRQLLSKVGIGDEKAIQQEIDDAKERDKAIMQTGGGLVGNIGGQIGMTLLPGGALAKGGQAMTAIPRLASVGQKLATAGQALVMPNSIKAAAAAGGAMGALQPVASDDMGRLANMAFGAGGGAGGILAGRALTAGGQGLKALAEPFYEGGRENIVGRTLNRSADDVNAAIANMRSAQQFVPGSVPTLGEASGDAGLASLQLAASSDPNVKAQLMRRAMDNNAARIGALESIAGAPGQRDFFDASRKTAAKQLYDQALSEQPVLTPWIKGQLTQLEQRPAFGEAVKEAKIRALNEGVKLDENNVTQVVHYAKLSLDDMIDKARRAGSDAAGLISTKEKLVSLIESKDFAPSYRQARDTYAQMSKPINQMDVGQYLVDKVRPALMDLSNGAPTRMNANAYASSLRDSAGTVRAATGRNGTLESMMEPDQMALLTGVGKDLARKAVSDDMAKTVGSTTAQNLTTRNVMRQILGPTGLPESWAESTALQTMLKPANWLLNGEGGAEAKTRETLVKALLDSGYGANLMGKTNAALTLTPQQLAQREMLAKLMLGSGAYTGMSLPIALQAQQQ